MKIALIGAYQHVGSWVLSHAAAEALRLRGHDVVEIETGKDGVGLGELDRSLANFDAAHWWDGRAVRYFPEVVCPKVFTFHHSPFDREEHYRNMLAALQPDAIHVTDRFAQRQLARWGHTSTYIPQAFDHSRWSPLPMPKEFTVGYLGTAVGGYKRFEVIQVAAELAGVPCIGLASEPWQPQEKIDQFFRDISCFVVASWDEGGPLPAQEALLCGRPVITTWVGMMPDIVRSGANGEFFDGTPEDCAKQITRVRSHIKDYEAGAKLGTKLPKIGNVAIEFEKLYKRIA